MLDRSAVRWAVAAWLTVLGTTLTFAPGAPATVVIDDYSQLLAAILVVDSARRTAQVLRGRASLAWWLVSAYAALWLGGQVVWTIGHAVGRAPGQSFAMADLLLFAAAVPAALGLGLLARLAELRRSWLTRLDLAGIVLATALTMWVLVMHPAVDELGIMAGAGAVLLGSAGNGAVLVAGLMVFARAKRRGEALLAASLLLLALDASMHTSTVARGAYLPATVLGLGWTLGLLGIALAGRRARASTDRSTVAASVRSAPVQLAVQSVPLLVVWSVFLVQRVQLGRIGGIELAVGFGVFLLVLIRLGVTTGMLEAREDDLEAQVTRDELTGLLNRRGLWDAGARMLAASPAPCVLALVDLRDLREVNDRLGVAGGDALVRAAAQRLSAVLPSGALVARPSNDFAVLYQVQGDGLGPAAAFARELAAVAAGPHHVEGSALTVGVSVGWSVTISEGRTVEDLYRQSGLALAAAKRSGPGQVRGYDEAMHQEMVARHDLSRQLRRAIDRGELVLHYQPVVDLVSGALVGAEALVRWDSPDRGLLGPAAFIPAAEETGMIVEIGRWVLAEASATMRRWEQQALVDEHFHVAVNLSSRQFDEPDFLDTVVRVVGRAGVEPHRIALEITETMAVDTPTVQPILHRLRDKGFEVALDDFGIAYSSLAYLRHLGIDTIKIDRLFVSELIGGGDEAEAIPQAIIDVASRLGLTLIAEGVETREQASRLVTMGCDRAQGFLFSPAVPGDTLTALLEDQTRGAAPFAAHLLPTLTRTSTPG